MAYGDSYSSTSTSTTQVSTTETQNEGEKITSVGNVNFTHEDRDSYSSIDDLPEDNGMDDVNGGEEDYSEETSTNGDDSSPNGSPPLSGEITFDKVIYSRRAFNQKIDTNISELRTIVEPVNIGKFFRDYRDLFFDIPKVGEESHTTLLESSKDYIEDYEDPKDVIIRSLEDQIRDLEFELTNPDEPGEHPIFTNGTLIKIRDQSSTTHLMDQGYRRYLNWDEELINTLKIAKYGNVDAEIIEISEEIMNQIPKGYPNISVDNFSEPFDPRKSEAIGKINYLNYAYLDVAIYSGFEGANDVTVFNAHEYANRHVYLERLEKKLEQRKIILNKLLKYIIEARDKVETLQALDPAYYDSIISNYPGLNLGADDSTEDTDISDITFEGAGSGARAGGSGGSGGGSGGGGY